MDRADPYLPLYTPEGLLVSAVVSNPSVYDQVRWLDKDLFGHVAVREVYAAVGWVISRNQALSSDELVEQVRNVLQEWNKVEALNLLVRLVSNPSGVAVNAPLYAQQVWERRQHDDLRSAGLRFSQIVSADWSLTAKRSALDEMWSGMVECISGEPGWQPIDGLSSVTEFMAQGDSTHDWVVPGLLERQERFMVIAPEKAGKTVLTRQVALMLANGRHPLSPSQHVPPMRTLLVDLENPAPSARRDFRRQVESMDDVWQADNGRAYILHRPAGMHLGDHVDRLTLTQAVEHLGIDLLCISPIYKAYDRLEQSWEEQAFGVQKPLDKLRERFNCAIWMEHHPPGRESGRSDRDIRPFGSTRWGRWLDYQVALKPEIGDHPPYKRLWWNSVQRDEAKMSPRSIRRGTVGEPSWVPDWDNGDDIGFDLALHEAEA